MPRSITIELTDEQAKRIDQLADFYGKTPEKIVEGVIQAGLPNFKPDSMDVLRKLASYIEDSVPANNNQPGKALGDF